MLARARSCPAAAARSSCAFKAADVGWSLRRAQLSAVITCFKSGTLMNARGWAETQKSSRLTVLTQALLHYFALLSTQLHSLLCLDVSMTVEVKYCIKLDCSTRWSTNSSGERHTARASREPPPRASPKESSAKHQHLPQPSMHASRAHSLTCTNVLPATFFSPKRPTRLTRKLPGPSASR